MQAFVVLANDLASAIRPLLPVLHRFEQTPEHAENLLRALEQRPNLPSLADHTTSWFLQRQFEHIDNCIWNGALPPDEHLRERRAFWADVLANLKPTTNREDIAKAVDKLLLADRTPAQEVTFLDAVRERERNDEAKAELMTIVKQDQSTPRSRYERWRALKEWGLRQYARTTERGKATINFSLSVTAQRSYSAPGDPLPNNLRWATEFQGATDALYAPARAAGFDVTGRQPIHALVQHLRDILNGGEVDLHESIKAVDLIIDELVRDEPSPQEPGKDDLMRLHAESAWGPRADAAPSGTVDGPDAPDLDTLLQPPTTASLPSGEFDYTKSSEASVTAIVRALDQLRTAAPNVKPFKEQTKDKAGVTGGAGDRAIECAMRNKLITPDLLVTDRGKAFLKDRS
jgi:hypothetical protein